MNSDVRVAVHVVGILNSLFYWLQSFIMSVPSPF